MKNLIKHIAMNEPIFQTREPLRGKLTNCQENQDAILLSLHEVQKTIEQVSCHSKVSDISPDISLLYECLESKNKFVTYSARKILNLLIFNSEIDPMTILNTTVQFCYSENTRSLHVLNAFTDILLHKPYTIENAQQTHSVATGQNIPENESNIEHHKTVKINLYKLLESHWTSLVQEFVTNKHAAPEMVPDFLLAFLTLWEQLLSYETSLPNDNIKEFSSTHKTALMPEVILKIVLDDCTTRLVFSKTLDVLNAAIPYGTKLSLCKDVSAYESMVTTIIQPINIKQCFRKLEYQHVHSTFCGLVKDQDCDQMFMTDVPLLQKLSLLLLKASALSARGGNAENLANIAGCLTNLTEFLHRFWNGHLSESKPTSVWMDLYRDNDELMVEAMVCLLDVHLYSEKSSMTLESIHNPHNAFLHFLNKIDKDHLVLLDFLTSPETCFPIYFTKYLKCVANDWQTFVMTHKAYISSMTDEPILSEGTNDNFTTAETVVKDTVVDDVPEYMERSMPLVCYSDSSGEEENAIDDHQNHDKESVYKNKIFHDSFYNDCIHEQQTLIIKENNKIHTPEDGENSLNATLADPVIEGDSQCLIVLDDTMSVLIRLRLAMERLVSKELFPYNGKPILTLLENVEYLYEN